MIAVRRLGILVALGALSCASPPPEDSAPPEVRAVRYLAREVPQWRVKNKCFSCHNNGDAARALIAARGRGVAFEDSALESTRQWLRRPGAWKDNGPQVEFSDQKLATLQFAHALAADGGDRDALVAAAEQLRGLQEQDGSWAVDADGLPGSPVTYGRLLATVVARKVLVAADRDRFADALNRSGRWLNTRKPVLVLDAAALLYGERGDAVDCVEVLRRGQARDGGWGPDVTSPPEVFDTALVLLALSAHRARPGVPEMIRRGREYLIAAQERDGSWPETTRPPGAESYAQRISTTGWALLALLSTPETK
jgi:hypothetical protein